MLIIKNILENCQLKVLRIPLHPLKNSKVDYNLRARSVTSVQKSTVSAKALPSEKTAKPGVNGGKTVKKKVTERALNIYLFFLPLDGLGMGLRYVSQG